MSKSDFASWMSELLVRRHGLSEADDLTDRNIADLKAEFIACGLNPDAIAAAAREQLTGEKQKKDVPVLLQSKDQRSLKKEKRVGHSTRQTRSVHFIKTWEGTLNSIPRLRVASAQLSNGAATYVAFELPMDRAISDSKSREKIAWASGGIRMVLARSDDGGVRAIKASVDKTNILTGSHISLAFRDQSGSVAILVLRPDAPHSIFQEPPLRGETSTIRLTVTILVE